MMGESLKGEKKKEEEEGGGKMAVFRDSIHSREEGTEGHLYSNPNLIQFGQVGYEEQARRSQSGLPNPESNSSG